MKREKVLQEGNALGESVGLDDSFGQTINQKIRTPLLVGGPPPEYPGDKPQYAEANEPSESNLSDYRAEFKIWEKKAKDFVQSSSLLLLQWDKKLDPRDPANPNLQIL